MGIQLFQALLDSRLRGSDGLGDFLRSRQKWWRHKTGGIEMNMACIGCTRDVNLDHVIIENYNGPVKCFSCGTMMEIRTVGGVLDSVAPHGGSSILKGGAMLFPERTRVPPAGRKQRYF
jgi:hypothetical protein